MLIGKYVVSKVDNAWLTKGQAYFVVDYDEECDAVLVDMGGGSLGWLLSGVYSSILN